MALKRNKENPSWYWDEAEHFKDDSAEHWLEATYYWSSLAESEGAFYSPKLKVSQRKQLIQVKVILDEEGLIQNAFTLEDADMIDRDEMILGNYLEEDPNESLDDGIIYELDGGE